MRASKIIFASVSILLLLAAASQPRVHAQVQSGFGAMERSHFAQEPKTGAAKPAPSQEAQSARVTVEVSGGDPEKPVENASVYFKFFQERKLKKDKKLELNVKTSRGGTAHIPDAPMGRILIQVVADGWKTFGRWYDITDPQQTIKIHLEKPPQWY